MIIRDAGPDDRAAWGRLWQGFLDYYDTTLPPAVTERQAAENGRRPDEEAEYLLIHGLLHLLGHDHAEPDEKAVMFGLNDRIIAEWQGRTKAGGRVAGRLSLTRPPARFESEPST